MVLLRFDCSGLRRSEYTDSSDAVKTAWTQFDDNTLESSTESAASTKGSATIGKPLTTQAHEETDARNGNDADTVVLNPMQQRRSRDSIDSPPPDVDENNGSGSDGDHANLNNRSGSRRSWRRLTAV